MKKNTYRGLASLTLVTALALTTTSCFKDLDRDPPLNAVTTDQIFRDPAVYRSVLAKLYAGLNLTGQSFTGQGDITADDEGQTAYSRIFWKLQELTADHSVVVWNDGAIQDLNFNTWTSTNNFVRFMYDRIYLEVGLCNEYLRETTDDKLSSRGISGADAERARAYRAEARFLRALAYSHAADLFGRVPITTEADPVGYFYPEQKSRAEVFAFVERELKEIEGQLPVDQEYGRASKGAAQTLLARIYLNAEVYTGTARYADCVEYCSRVMNSGKYSLAPYYRNLFNADNDFTSAQEMIFPITQDGLRSRTFGGATFLVHASVAATPRGAQLKPIAQGVGEGWGGIRARIPLPLLFADSATIMSAVPLADQRAYFSTVRVSFGQNSKADVNGSPTSFNFGVTVRKWSNITSTGVRGSDMTSNNAVDTDIPFLRLGDVYLMYAEAVKRGGGGDAGLALQKLNELRQRAHKNAMGVVQNYPGDLGSYDLDFILAERGREMYWEGTRRTDLIRFGRYTGGTYLWPFKGSDATNNRRGTPTPEHTALFPIPAAELTANPKIKQNPGY